MRITLLLLATSFMTSLSAQDTNKVKHFEVLSQGGAWVGTNGHSTVVSLPAAKLSWTFTMSSSWKLELGALLLPGYLSDKTFDGRPAEQVLREGRPGLSLGTVAIIRGNGWKMKPIVGVTFHKDATNIWQVVPGFGFTF